jgi:hypothetical protein
MLNLIIAILLLIVIILLYLQSKKSESFTERSVDMVDFRNSDPKLSKYTTRSRDSIGMGGDDYYYENDTLYRQGVEPEKHGRSAFESEYGIHADVEPGQRGNDYEFFGDAYWDLPKGISMMGSVESAEPFEN